MRNAFAWIAWFFLKTGLGRTARAGLCVLAGLVCLAPAAWAACTSPAAEDGTGRWFPATGGSPTGCSSVGDVCSDGSVFAGDTDLYVTDINQSAGIAWSTETVNTGADSDTDGAANQQWIVDNETLSEYPAFELCENLNRHGRTDWYLPARNELYDVLYQNRSAIGGFTNGYYWSSTENDSNDAWMSRFGVNDEGYDAKAYPLELRCVRRDSGGGETPGTYKICVDDTWVPFENESTLGSCAAEGALAYDSGESAFKQCDGSNWQKIECATSGSGGAGSCSEAGGVAVGGYCWYLGGWGETCDQVCSDHGGCNLAGTRDYAGSGGINQNCENILGALTEDMTDFAGSDSADAAIGCTFAFGSVGVRVSSPQTSCAANPVVYQRACACNEDVTPGGGSCTSLGSCSTAGVMEYDDTNKVMRYCDGADWYPLAQ